PGGQVNILAGAGKPALAVTPGITNSIASAAMAAPNSNLPPVEVNGNPLSAILAWIDRLDSLGLDGGSLSEIGLKDCTLVVEDERDGTLQLLEGRILAGTGYFGSRDDPDSRIHIDEAQLNLRWNAATRQLQMPLDAQSGPSRVNLMAQLDVPDDAGAPWTLNIPRGLIVFASPD